MIDDTFKDIYPYHKSSGNNCIDVHELSYMLAMQHEDRQFMASIGATQVCKREYPLDDETVTTDECPAIGDELSDDDNTSRDDEDSDAMSTESIPFDINIEDEEALDA